MTSADLLLGLSLIMNYKVSSTCAKSELDYWPEDIKMIITCNLKNTQKDLRSSFVCFFCVCFMYILCVYGPSACNKTDDDDDDLFLFTKCHCT